MRQRKVFAIAIEPDEEPIEFDLVFTKADGSTEKHEFTADPSPGARGALTVASVVRYDDGGVRRTDLNGLMRFFSQVMPADDYTRLQALIDRRDLTIPMETLGDLFSYITEEQTGRPPTPSSGSSNGRSTTGRRSTGLPS